MSRDFINEKVSSFFRRTPPFCGVGRTSFFIIFIFLLSAEELQDSEYGFTATLSDSLGSRKITATDYALARFLDGSSWYSYTLDPGLAKQKTPYVKDNGNLNWTKNDGWYGVNVNFTDYGIVSACVVKLGN